VGDNEVTVGANDQVITLKTPVEIELMHHANQIVAGALHLLRENSKEGVSTYTLDKLAEEYCRDHNAIPAFKGYNGFPASLCASVNEEVVHGIPSKSKILHDGDIVSLDFGTLFQGFYGDAAITVPVGEIPESIRELLEVTKSALMLGIAQAKIGNRISDICKAVQVLCEALGFSVVRQFVGHGIGSRLHEPPEIPNYVQRQASPRLLEGMVLAIEPMVNLGGAKVKILRDQWTVVTADRKPSAHFEHSVAITQNGPFILSEYTSA
jgi:methionyl aminopeptidase